MDVGRYGDVVLLLFLSGRVKNLGRIYELCCVLIDVQFHRFWNKMPDNFCSGVVALLFLCAFLLEVLREKKLYRDDCRDDCWPGLSLKIVFL